MFIYKKLGRLFNKIVKRSHSMVNLFLCTKEHEGDFANNQMVEIVKSFVTRSKSLSGFIGDCSAIDRCSR